MKNQLIKITGKSIELSQNEYFAELLAYQAQFTPIKAVANLLEQVLTAMQALAAGYLPAQLPELMLTDDMIAASQAYVLQRYPHQPAKGNELWAQLAEGLEQIDFLLRHFRDALIESFSMYSYVSSPFINALSEYTAGAAVLEVMAGHGYLTAGLQAVNPAQVVIATDNEDWRLQPDPTKAEPVTAVQNIDALAALAKYLPQVDYLIISWAPDTNTLDLEVIKQALQLKPAIKIIIIGEKDGATNSAAFWQKSQLEPITQVNRYLKSFDLIDEQAYLLTGLN
ncbi:SAM-dependent methyltransferase [Weissella oryzae SG25]|uniref:SAM-dependent methyltransferase n=1 Tax=Weissella oryzae (strain DSM 25784 / JCM 18191 / LMG 30913 / SG25) TaxID=1329250 RepID=A0A069CS11_WEIOS|nr:hypothetical protein [Weissella oryzae]GAK30008.1 SAM-dependent methyltransferase [Weissella oryzae SG25]